MHELHLGGLIAVAAYGDLQLEVQHPDAPAGTHGWSARQGELPLLQQPYNVLLDAQS